MYNNNSQNNRMNKIKNMDYKKLIHDMDNNYNKPHYIYHKFNANLNAFSNIPYLKKNIIWCSQDNILYNVVDINVKINDINDLIQLANKYPLKYNVKYNINMDIIHSIKQPLIKLNNMIGMNKIKTSIVQQIVYYIQDLHIGSSDYMHTCIYGQPGTGKTELAIIIGEIFGHLGILQKGNFKKVVRSDLVAGYLGQTALKTQDVIKDAVGGVLFIDEVYALGNSEKRDSFSKECIDTLCEALSNHKNELMVIIAGYKDEINDCFFSYNKGLRSRFTWSFETEDYNANELRLIFEKKISDIGWKIKYDDTYIVEWFNKNKDLFKYYGRDIENLVSKVKITHSKRVFCLDHTHKRVITEEDMLNGLELFILDEDIKQRRENKSNKFNSMYL